MSSIPTPSSSSARTAWAMMPERRRIGAWTIRPSQVGRPSAIPASAEIARSRSASSSRRTSRRSPPTWSLSSSEVPSAITLPWSITTIRSARRSASSRYWVVSRTVVPAAVRASIVSHIDRRLTGSRPVVGSSRYRTGGRNHERGTEVQAPAHAAGVGLRRALGGVDEVEALEQLVRPLARARSCSGGTAGRPSPRFSKPVRFSSTAAYWPARPILARSAAACLTTSRPTTRACPPSGCSSVDRMRTAVVLPAPFGPSSPRTVPVGALKSTPQSAWTAP